MILLQSLKTNLYLIGKGINYFRVIIHMLDMSSSTTTSLIILLNDDDSDNYDSSHRVKSCSLYQTSLFS